ncbi:MAG: tetratricopeptide repeat protein [Vicinamibacteria bacterium]
MYRRGRGAVLLPSAESGDVDAQFALGQLYFEGAPENSIGVGFNPAVLQDLPAAARWLERAADQGHAGARNLLGSMYAEGKGVEQSLPRATELWRQASGQGNRDEH